MVLLTGERTTGDPFFDAFRARQPAADLILLPPEARDEQTALDPEEAERRLDGARAAVAQESGALAAVLGTATPEEPTWRYGDTPGEVVAEVRGTVRIPGDRAPALLATVEDRLTDDGWSIRPLTDGIPRLVGGRDGDGVLIAHVAAAGVVEWRCWSAPVPTGKQLARRLAEKPARA